MDDIDFEDLREKFKKLYDHPDYGKRGGFFTTRRRKQLLGVFGKTGRDRKKYDFWYDVRESAKTALVDLQLFIETADDADVNKVVNEKTMTSIANVLLWYPVVSHSKPDSTRAEIAKSLIRTGFSYLQYMSGSHLTTNQRHLIRDAVELSEQLSYIVSRSQEEE